MNYFKHFESLQDSRKSPLDTVHLLNCSNSITQLSPVDLLLRPTEIFKFPLLTDGLLQFL